MFEKALCSGNISSEKGSLQLWTAYIDYLRRRVHHHDNQVTSSIINDIQGGQMMIFSTCNYGNTR